MATVPKRELQLIHKNWTTTTRMFLKLVCDLQIFMIASTSVPAFRCRANSMNSRVVDKNNFDLLP